MAIMNVKPANSSKFLAFDLKVKLEVSKQNFVFKATEIWNNLIGISCFFQEINL